MTRRFSPVRPNEWNRGGWVGEWMDALFFLSDFSISISFSVWLSFLSFSPALSLFKRWGKNYARE